ncbi:MAG: sulfate transporter family protein [Hyphomicrobiales bacterium]|nr:sulfate transporter family protein [Hyphomicrobiales bacterium]
MARASGFAMVAASVRDGVGDLLSPPFRGVALRSLGVTLVIVVALWALGTRFFTGFAGDYAGAHPVNLPFFLDGVLWIAGIFSGLALMIGFSFLIAPITAAVAGLFLDEVAEAVEATHYPQDAAGRAMPLGESLMVAARFTALSLLVNLVCLMLLLIPGINLVAFFVGNGWLIGREYFAFAARRLMGKDEAARFARAHSGAATTAGLIAALLLSVPFLNFLTPLFATATMVHLAKRASGSRPS